MMEGLKPFTIGPVSIDPPVMLAPMAGVCDLAFREICEDMGAAYTCTEMVSAKALCFNDRKTAVLLEKGNIKKPFAAQIFGSEPDICAEGARRALEMSGACVIDINMGCPTPKIVSNGDGSALMGNPKLAGKIISAVCRAVPCPVTVKFRAGTDDAHKNAVEFARMAEGAGASAVCVHGRTARQMYTGRADRVMIAQVKQAVHIPVFANGDIDSGESALSMLKETGADGVAVGRGAMGNPWIFSEICAALCGKQKPPTPSMDDRLDTVRRQVKRACEIKGMHVALLEARKHLAWYLKGVPGARGYRARASQVSTFDDLNRLLMEIREHLDKKAL